MTRDGRWEPAETDLPREVSVAMRLPVAPLAMPTQRLEREPDWSDRLTRTLWQAVPVPVPGRGRP